MSKRSKASIPGDRYTSPDWLVAQLVDDLLPDWLPATLWVNGGEGLAILDAGAGEGVFVRHLRRAFPKATIHAIDIHPFKSWAADGADASFHGDFLAEGFRSLRSLEGHPLRLTYDLIAGNPPFSIAEAFIRRGLELARYLSYVLRQGFLASNDRCEPGGLWRTTPPQVLYQVAHRPRFRLDLKGADSADYMWYCWPPERGAEYATREPRVRWLPVVPKDARRLPESMRAKRKSKKTPAELAAAARTPAGRVERA